MASSKIRYLREQFPNRLYSNTISREDINDIQVTTPLLYIERKKKTAETQSVSPPSPLLFEERREEKPFTSYTREINETN